MKNKDFGKTLNRFRNYNKALINEEGSEAGMFNNEYDPDIESIDGIMESDWCDGCNNSIEDCECEENDEYGNKYDNFEDIEDLYYNNQNEEIDLDEIDIEESNTGNSGVGMGISTPNAFASTNDEEEFKKHSKGTTELPGWIETKKSNRWFKEYKDNAKPLNEERELTPRGKVASAIREIRDNLKNIEKMIENTAKLKLEVGVTSDNYWKRTKGALLNIGERLIRLNQKINEIK